MQLMLAVVFILSGAAGLLYESIWSRYLGLFVGHSAYAQVLVLVIFLGGMSVGAWGTARVSQRIAEPLLLYAVVEALVGVIGFGFDDGYRLVTTWAYDVVFPALPNSSVATLVRWGLGAALILPQSILLGATFPLMSAGVLRRTRGDRSGRALAVLYAANSLGAAGGVMLAGFLFLPLLGLPGTVLTAAVTNMICALAVYLIVRTTPPSAAPIVVPVDSPMVAEELVQGLGPSWTRRRLSGVLFATAFGTAVASFLYEVAWIRMLSLVLGSATHSFELMLSAFILGLAGGAWWIRSRIDTWRDRIALLVRIQVGMALLAALTVILYLGMFDLMASMLAALARTESGYRLFALFRYGLCLLIMLPATVCAGMTLPIITRILADAKAGAESGTAGASGESAIGQVYAVNTIGSIMGAALGSLVLMPLLGVRLLVLTGAVLDLACAYLLVWGMGAAAHRIRPQRIVSLVGATLILTGLIIGIRFDPLVLSSGVFRTGRASVGQTTSLLSYVDGRTASVSVTEAGPTGQRRRSIATNGKPDASLTRTWMDTLGAASGAATFAEDEATQALLPLITLAHRPDARRAAVIGQGSGMSSHFLLASTQIDSLFTIEIEPAMIAASRAFYPANRRVFDDPRSRFLVDDARSIFASRSRGFDLIMSEPSNPWVSGVSGLFTEEFYARVRQSLAPGGVFGQWMHLYEMSDPLLLTVLRALYAQFPVFRIYLTNSLDLLIVASTGEVLPPPNWPAVADLPAIRHDLRPFRPIAADHIERALAATSVELAPLLEVGFGRNSDFFPLLDLGAEEARFLGQRVEGIGGGRTAQDRFDVYAALGERRRGVVSAAAGPLTVPAVVQATAAADVRAGVRPTEVDTTARARLVRDGLQRVQAFRRDLRANEPPIAWGPWVEQVREVHTIWNAGQSGVADLTLLDEADDFATRHAAPKEVFEVLRFEGAVAVWDWQGVAAAGLPLVASRIATGRRWVDDDYVREALVTALLKLRRNTEAGTLFERLAPYSARRPDDLRTLLLGAYLTNAPAG